LVRPQPKADPLARGGLRQAASTDRPDRARPSHALYGLARGDARSLGFESRHGRIISAQLSRIWTIAGGNRSEPRAGVEIVAVTTPVARAK
jgi:hypothetical protein